MDTKYKSLNLISAYLPDMDPFKRKMLDRIDKIQIRISLLLKVALLVMLILSLVRMDFFLIFSSVIALFFAFLPSIIERNYKINLPNEFETFVILFLFLHFALGEMRGFYEKIAWWDLMMHSSSAIMLGMLGFMIVYTLFYTREVRCSPLFAAIFTFSFVLALGAVWELFEFSMDVLLNFNMQKSGLIDTMTDLLLDTIGALFSSVFGYLYITKKRKGFIHRLISRFYAFNKKIF